MVSIELDILRCPLPLRRGVILSNQEAGVVQFPNTDFITQPGSGKRAMANHHWYLFGGQFIATHQNNQRYTPIVLLFPYLRESPIHTKTIIFTPFNFLTAKAWCF